MKQRDKCKVHTSHIQSVTPEYCDRRLRQPQDLKESVECFDMSTSAAVLQSSLEAHNNASNPCSGFIPAKYYLVHDEPDDQYDLAMQILFFILVRSQCHALHDARQARSTQKQEKAAGLRSKRFKEASKKARKEKVGGPLACS